VTQTDQNALPSRVRNYFERQIAWLKEALVQAEDLQENPPEDLPDQAIRDQQRHAAALSTFVEESRLMAREWQAANDISEAHRDEIRVLAQEVQRLVECLTEAQGEVLKRIQPRMGALRAQLTEIRKGRELLRNYRTQERRGAPRMDTEA